MKKIFLLLLIVSMQAAFADWYNYETRSQTYDRRSYENYQTYKNNNYQAPLGGYNRPMNDDGGRQFGTVGNHGTTIRTNNPNSFSNNQNNWNRY